VAVALTLLAAGAAGYAAGRARSRQA
jgi:hypothetical protein